MSRQPARTRAARPGPRNKTAPGADADAAVKEAPLVLQFDDNSALALLFGEHDRNLARLERELGVEINARGNRVRVSGPEGACMAARDALTTIYDRIRGGAAPGQGEVDAIVRHAAAGTLVPPGRGGGGVPDRTTIETRRRRITARTPTQAAYIDAMREHELVLGLGPAGTGKTYLAVATAVAMLQAGEVDRIILSRPAVEAGERLGFLPGDLREKVDPYLRPLYDALYDMLPGDQVVKRLTSGEIEVAPLAFMRGRTLAHAFIILDEAQNTTSVQMKMCLTRMGEGSRMVVTGDLSQVDLPTGTRSGLADAVEALAGVDGVAMVHFTAQDMVRHPLVNRVVRAYEDVERKRAARSPAEGGADPAAVRAKTRRSPSGGRTARRGKEG